VPPSNDALVRGLIEVLDETNSKDTFCLAVQVLGSLKGEGRRGIPAALRSAERLGISDGMGNGTASCTQEQRVLASILPPDLEALRSLPKLAPSATIPGVRQVQMDVCIAEVADAALPGLTACLKTDGRQAAAVAGGLVQDRQRLLACLEELRRVGGAKLLAEPHLVTLSGKRASFLTGGKVAVPDLAGTGAQAVHFEDYGTGLDVLPVIQGNGKVRLEVEPVVRTVQRNSIAVTPAINTQRLHACVEMAPGQTFAIVFRKHGAAGVSDSPFLQAFFQPHGDDEAGTGMVILVTPHFMDTHACDQLPR
jgi:type II secretory pathway component HofQ